MSGNAELPNDEDVERRVKRLPDFEGDRHTSARESEDDYVVPVRKLPQVVRECQTRLSPIGESRG